MWQTNKTGPVLAHHCQPTVSNTITRRWHRNSLLKWLLVMITMMIRMIVTSRTGTEADSGDWSPVLSKCHQCLIILYVVYHGSSISQADCNHLLLRRLTTKPIIQLRQTRNVVSVLTSWSGDPLRPWSCSEGLANALVSDLRVLVSDS